MQCHAQCFNIFLSILPKSSYWWINISVYYCVLINKMFSVMDKSFEMSRNNMRKSLAPAQSFEMTFLIWEKALYSMVILWSILGKIVLLLSVIANDHIYMNAKASNTFKQWCIVVLRYFWHNVLILLEPVLSHH